jgi:hypothetical protein
MSFDATVAPTGSLTLTVTKRVRRAPLSWRIQNFIENKYRNLPALWLVWPIARLFKVPMLISSLRLRALHADGTVTDYGIVGRRVVTDTGVGYIVDAFQNSVELENMKFHGFGTGTGAEAAGDTALGTELTTEYAVNSTRPTGTTTEGATANIYRTVATLSPDSGGTLAITEHGVFSASSAGVLLDRTKFSAVNLVAGSDSLAATYELTFTSGS